MTDVILLFYTILLCFQRIVVKDYPCILNMVQQHDTHTRTQCQHASRNRERKIHMHRYSQNHLALFLSSSSLQWSGYIGTIILFNSYLWRCWTLYFNFNLTHVRLHSSTRSLDGSDGGTNLNFFIRNRWMTSSRFLMKVATTVFVLLMIPPFILSVTYTRLADEYGDGCDQSWGQTLLAVYVGVYVALFSWFSFSLRSVVDGFKIKTELKITGFIALMAVVPWLSFNQYASSVNTDTFPFSTMFLLIACVAAFTASTIYPLYASLFGAQSSQSNMLAPGLSSFSLLGPSSGRGSFQPLNDFSDDSNGVVGGGVDGNVNGASMVGSFNSQGHPERLFQILDEPSGLEAFTQFLTKEFSVENIVFYRAIEELRIDIRRQRLAGTYEPRAFLIRSRAIHEKYIQTSAAYQVNLPDPVVRSCEAHLKYEAHQHGIPMVLTVSKATGTKKTNFGHGGVGGSGAGGGAAGGSDVEDWSHPPPPQQPPMDHLDRSTPTLFDDAQRTIYILMEKDSMLRFVRSDLFKTWIETKRQEEHKKKVLAEMNLV